MNNPKIIIADEPTGNVDPDLSFEIVDLLSEINRRGTTVLMVTHEHDLVQHFHKRVIEIHGGVVVADTNVKNQPQPYVRGASVPNTPEQEQDTFQDDDLLDDDYREDDAGEQVTYPDSDYQEMLRRYSVASRRGTGRANGRSERIYSGTCKRTYCKCRDNFSTGGSVGRRR